MTPGSPRLVLAFVLLLSENILWDGGEGLPWFSEAFHTVGACVYVALT